MYSFTWEVVFSLTLTLFHLHSDLFLFQTFYIIFLIFIHLFNILLLLLPSSFSIYSSSTYSSSSSTSYSSLPSSSFFSSSSTISSLAAPVTRLMWILSILWILTVRVFKMQPHSTFQGCRYSSYHIVKCNLRLQVSHCTV